MSTVLSEPETEIPVANRQPVMILVGAWVCWCGQRQRIRPAQWVPAGSMDSYRCKADHAVTLHFDPL